MNYRKMIAPAVVIAGLCGLGVSPAFAEDTSPVEQCPGEPSSCVRLNGGGSSAATPFMNEVPLVILDQGNAGGTLHYPVHYLSTNGKRATWTGTRGGGVTPTIIRYEATGSADGIQKLQHPVADSGSFMTYVDHSSPGTTCDAPLFLTNPVNGKKYFEYRNCTATVQYGMTMGMSDVNGSSFHQSSPGPTGTIIKNPLSMTGLKSTQVAQIPWTIVLGAAVQKVVNGVHQNVQNLTRTQVEEIFSGIAYDWTQLGLVVVDSSETIHNTLGDAPITLCLRQAGSGSKAGFDETTMKDASEVTTGTVDLSGSASGVYYYGASTQDVVDCIQGNTGRPAHRDAAGYIDRDTAELYDGVGTGTVKLISDPGKWWDGKPAIYPVNLNGLSAHDMNETDHKIHVKCGEYLYFAGERENVRSGTDPGIDGGATSGPVHTLATAFTTASSAASSITEMPAGAFWVANSDMYVSKNLDGGPIVPNDAENPCNH